MGNFPPTQSARAKNVSKQILNESINVCQQSISSMGTTVNGANIIDVEGCTNVNLNHIHQSMWINIDVTSKQFADAKAQLSQTLKDQISQKAQAVSTGLGLNHTDSENLINSSINVATNVNQTFIQSCLAYITVANEMKLGNCTGVNANYIDQSLAVNYTSSCIMKNTSVVTATQDLETTISQSASAKSVGLTLPNFMELIAIIAAVAIVFIGTGTYLLSSKAGLVILLLGLILMVAGGIFVALFFLKTWPYQFGRGDTDVDGKPIDKNFNTVALSISIGVSVIGIILLVVGGYMLIKK